LGYIMLLWSIASALREHRSFRHDFSRCPIMCNSIGSEDMITAISGENLEAEKPLITRSNLQWNHVYRGCQLWQVTESLLSRLKRKANFGNLQSPLFQTYNWKSKIFWALLRQNFGKYLQT
jgi:hypothetical protein